MTPLALLLTLALGLLLWSLLRAAALGDRGLTVEVLERHPAPGARDRAGEPGRSRRLSA